MARVHQSSTERSPFAEQWRPRRIAHGVDWPQVAERAPALHSPRIGALARCGRAAALRKMTENDNYNFRSEIFIASDGSIEREQARSKARRKAHRKKSAKQQWVRAILSNLRFLALRVAGLLREANDEKREDAYRRWVRKRAQNIIKTVKRTVSGKERARFFHFLAKASKEKLSRPK